MPEPKKRKPPNAIRPYLFHGLELDWESGEEELSVPCPFCDDEEGHLNINQKTGMGRCLRCGQGSKKEGIGSYVFIRLLWEKSDKATTDYTDLAKEKSLFPDTLMRWGACRSTITGEWLLPGYNGLGKITQLYRLGRKDGKVIMLATPKLDRREYGHGLFGVNLFDKDKSQVFICEGPWDGMALWQAFASHRIEEGKFVASSEESSLLTGANVLAVPGCGTFNKSWADLFEGKDVCLVYDNDHPRIDPKTNESLPPAGYAGMHRASVMIAEKASSIQFLKWGEVGYDASLPSGFDVKDLLTVGV